MPGSPVATIERERVTAHEPLHADAERGLERLDHEVQVIVHHAIGVNTPGEPLGDVFQAIEQRRAIAIVRHDAITAVASSDRVMERTLALRSWTPWHRAESAQEASSEQDGHAGRWPQQTRPPSAAKRGLASSRGTAISGRSAPDAQLTREGSTRPRRNSPDRVDARRHRRPRGRRVPDVERVERRRGGRPAGRALRRVARGDRPADDGALRHAPRGAAAGRAGRRPLRVASSRAPCDRRGGGRKRAAPRGRRVRACARRARDRRTRVGGRLRGGPRSRPCGWRRDGAAGGLRRLDHGRGRPRAHDRAVSHGRHELACSVLDGVAPRGRRRSPHAGRNRAAAHRARGALGRRRPHLASDRRTAGSDLRARGHRRELGRHAPRAPGSELDRSGPRRGARPLRRDPHTPLRRAARRPRRRAAGSRRPRSSAPRRAHCCSRSRDRSRSRRWARSFSGSSRACPSP